MVRFVATRVCQGHLPLTSWFPYLGLGSPQFLHYQSLPSMIRDSSARWSTPTVFRWSLPAAHAGPISVYWSAGSWLPLDGRSAAAVARSWPRPPASATRRRPTSGWATACGPSCGHRGPPPGLGFTGAPCRRCPAAFPAVLFIMLTVALRSDRLPRLRAPRRVAFPRPLGPVAAGRSRRGRWAAAALASAWVMVPLLEQSHWAARDQVRQGPGSRTATPPGRCARGFSAGTSTTPALAVWLPVITIFVGVGLGVCLARWRTFLAGRALVVCGSSRW